MSKIPPSDPAGSSSPSLDDTSTGLTGESVLSDPSTSETSEAVQPVAADGAVKPKPGALSERHHKYAEEFKQWMLGLNRHDFGQVRRVLEQMTRAYFKHTIKVHSPPMKDEQNDVSGTTSQGAPNLDLPPGEPAA